MKTDDYIISGGTIITSISFGNLIFQALGTFALAIIGALAAWVFTKIIKPKLDKLYDKSKKH